MPRQRAEDRVMIPRYIKGRIFKDCGEICAHCGKKLEFFGEFTLEHVIPLAKGGTNDLSNLVSLCETCNKAKSDDIIPPMEYFGFLPEKKRMQLQEMFDDFVTKQDWLDFDNLFMTDWFHLETGRTILLPKTGKAMFAPMHLEVRRIREEDANQRIQDYKKHLSEADRTLMVKPEDKLRDPYYEVLWNGTQLMFFTAYIQKGEDAFYAEDWAYVLQIDYYFNPEVRHNKYTTAPTIYNILMSILDKIQATLLNGSQGTAILTRLRAPKSTPMAEWVSEFFQCVKHGSAEIYDVNLQHRHPDASIRVIEFIMFQGNQQELKKLMAEYNAQSFDELNKSLDEEKIQKSIADRLQHSRKINRRGRTDENRTAEMDEDHAQGNGGNIPGIQ